MTAIDQLLRDFVKREDLPFVVAMAGNSKGVTYSGAAGDAAPHRAANESTVFRVFSITKAVGSIAAMMLIDRGRLNAETPVEDLLPEFANIRVLDRFVNQSQFIIITHNKRTIAKADILYGVTMEERGISKLVGMKLMTRQQSAPGEPAPAARETVTQRQFAMAENGDSEKASFAGR